MLFGAELRQEEGGGGEGGQGLGSQQLEIHPGLERVLKGKGKEEDGEQGVSCPAKTAHTWLSTLCIAHPSERKSRTPNSQTRLWDCASLHLTSPHTPYPMASPMASWMWDLPVKATGPASCLPMYILCKVKQASRWRVKMWRYMAPAFQGSSCFAWAGQDLLCMESARSLVAGADRARAFAKSGTCHKASGPVETTRPDQKDQPLSARSSPRLLFPVWVQLVANHTTRPSAFRVEIHT